MYVPQLQRYIYCMTYNKNYNVSKLHFEELYNYMNYKK